MKQTCHLVATDLNGAVWRKSTYSGGSEGQCVEVADMRATPYKGIAIRDSKNPSGPALLVPAVAFAVFATDAAKGRLNA